MDHIGSRLTVTSPAGFVGGASPATIITPPSASRHRSLAEAVDALRLAEREGIGVDRMVRDMLALGHPAPGIGELEGPHVRVSLVGGAPSATMMELLAALEPATTARDVDALLLLLHHCVRHAWLDVARTMSAVQRSRVDTEDAIMRLAEVRVGGDSVLIGVRGVPAEQPAAYRVSDAVRRRLTDAGLVSRASCERRRWHGPRWRSRGCGRAGGCRRRRRWP